MRSAVKPLKQREYINLWAYVGLQRICCGYHKLCIWQAPPPLLPLARVALVVGCPACEIQVTHTRRLTRSRTMVQRKRPADSTISNGGPSVRVEEPVSRYPCNAPDGNSALPQRSVDRPQRSRESVLADRVPHTLLHPSVSPAK